MSRSLGGVPLPLTDVKLAPFDALFKRSYPLQGPNGVRLQVYEREIDTGPKSVVIRYRVMGNRRIVDGRISSFTKSIYGLLSLFVIVSIAANALAVRFGLSPLKKAGESLKLIREGKSTRLEGEFPPEIAPLANEMNALIDNNRRIVERSRTQVGNLAHALKTPLAVMSNEGQALGGTRGAVIAEQTGAMQEQIQRYLQRARIGAQRGSVIYRAPISPILAPTLRAFQKLNPDKRFDFDLPEDELVFAGEGEDFQEMIGILLDNAAKWGMSRVGLKAARTRSPTGAAMFSVEICDDGPGLTPEQISAGIKRGRRMDEPFPGAPAPRTSSKTCSPIRNRRRRASGGGCGGWPGCAAAGRRRREPFHLALRLGPSPTPQGCERPAVGGVALAAGLGWRAGGAADHLAGDTSLGDPQGLADPEPAVRPVGRPRGP